jgi:cytidyltransferase-like protein
MSEVYVAMCADIIHRGHINILRSASAYGRVIVGLLSDEAVAGYKRVPFMSYEEREEIIRSIRWVDDVVRQDIASPAVYIEQLKPRYFLHGDDWRNSRDADHRDRVIRALNSYGGKLIEVPYTPGVSSTLLQSRLQGSEVFDAHRLRRYLVSKPVTRAFAVDGADAARAVAEIGVERKRFDVAWFKPAEASDRLDLNALFDVVEMARAPVIADCRAATSVGRETGIARKLQRIGVAGVCFDLRDLIGRPRIWEDIRSAGDDLVKAVAVPDDPGTLFSEEMSNVLSGADIILASVDGADAFRHVVSALDGNGGGRRSDGSFGAILSADGAINEDALPLDRPTFVLYEGERGASPEGAAEQAMACLGRITRHST